MNTEPLQQQVDQPEKNENFFVELIKFALLAAIIVIPFRMFVAEPYIVSGASMSPTFETGHYLIIDKLSHKINTVDRGTVVVFKYPNDPSKFYIKRVIATPGETIRIQNRKVFIQQNGSTEFVQLDEPYIKNNNQRDTEITVPAGNYYVMGDNRGNSSDSRAWGTLDAALIKGEPLLQLYPVNEIAIKPGEEKPIFIK